MLYEAVEDGSYVDEEKVEVILEISKEEAISLKPSQTTPATSNGATSATNSTTGTNGTTGSTGTTPSTSSGEYKYINRNLEYSTDCAAFNLPSGCLK